MRRKPITRMPITEAPVAVVGGGPVGLMLALFLDRHDVRSVVFNIEDASRQVPKGSTHNCRTMEHYRRLGLAGRVRSAGLPLNHPTDVAYFTRFGAGELARLPMPSAAEAMHSVARAGKTDQFVEPMHRANQMYVERILEEEARRRPNITLRFGWRVDAFTDRGDHVLVSAQSGVDGCRRDWAVRYLVGCDGGQSLVRRSLGIHYHGQERLQQAFLGGRMISTHLRAPMLHGEFFATRPAWQYVVLNPHLRLLLVSLNGKDEFLAMTKAAGPTSPPDGAAIVRMVQQAAGGELPVEILSQSSWNAGVALVAERFAVGRVLLAGDAVHLFTPTGGFGMNTGIDDVANLSWKLAAMVQGWGGAGLLETYETERQPIAFRNTTAARNLAKNIGTLELPPNLEEISSGGAAARQRLGAILGTFGAQFASPGVQLGARYDGSPIIVGDGAPPSDDLSAYRPTAIPGGRAPHLWLDQGRGAGSSLFDRLGIGFTLLRLGQAAPDVASVQAAACAREVPLRVLEVPDEAARDLYGRDLALIRPDQHVAWRGNRLPADADALFDTLLGV